VDQEDISLLAQDLEQSREFPKKDLKKLPKTVLLGIAIELDPDSVSEAYQEGSTKEDILKLIKSHIEESLGRSGTPGWSFLQDFDVVFTEVDDEEIK